jgi:hypothetical protein
MNLNCKKYSGFQVIFDGLTVNDTYVPKSEDL